jgi:ATP-dependent Clp protease ATP-binding subunit ClpC
MGIFERYTEHARRAIFFARHEALQSGAPQIDTGHLLLGLIHEPGSRANQILGLAIHSDLFQQQLRKAAASTKPKIKDIPLTNASKRALACTVEEADMLQSQVIDTEHLVLGLLREGNSEAATLLAGVGIDLESARDLLRQQPGLHPRAPAKQTETLKPLPAFILLVALSFAIYLIVRLAVGK